MWTARTATSLAAADETFFAELAKGVVAKQGDVDQAIVKRLASGWRLDRLDATARAVLRAGAFELMHRPDVPTEVVIDEYVEITKSFFEGPGGRIHQWPSTQSPAMHEPDEDDDWFADDGPSETTAPPPANEFDHIARLLRPLTRGDPVALDLLDDAAVLPSRPGYDLVITKDALVAGVHFLADEALDVVARRLLRTNLSDLAAKGAEPLRLFPGRWLALERGCHVARRPSRAASPRTARPSISRFWAATR